MLINNSQARTMQKHAVSSIKSRQDSVRLKKAWAMVRGGAAPTKPGNVSTVKTGSRIATKPHPLQKFGTSRGQI